MPSNEHNARQQALTQWVQIELNDPSLSLQLISGDASFRRYFRLTYQTRTLVAVDAPPPQEDCRQFLAVGEAYAATGVPVPQVLAEDQSSGFMLLEDLGDTLLLSQVKSQECSALYDQAITLLPAIAQVTETRFGALPAFDRAHLARENQLFREWLLERYLGFTLSQGDVQMLEDAFTVLSDNALAQPQWGVHRDFHARNLMVCHDGSLGVIDFQDAVVGPATYDLVSLLRDCYVEWDDDWVYAKLNSWASLMQRQGLLSQVSGATLQRWFDLMGIQRHVKASGIFCRLSLRDGKQGYLGDVPRTLGYIIRIAGQYPELATFAQWVQSRVLPAWSQG